MTPSSMRPLDLEVVMIFFNVTGVFCYVTLQVPLWFHCIFYNALFQNPDVTCAWLGGHSKTVICL